MQKRVTKDNRENPEYDVVAAINRLRTEKKSSRRTIMTKPCENLHAKSNGGESGRRLFKLFPAGSLCSSRVTHACRLVTNSHIIFPAWWHYVPSVILR